MSATSRRVAGTTDGLEVLPACPPSRRDDRLPFPSARRGRPTAPSPTWPISRLLRPRLDGRPGFIAAGDLGRARREDEILLLGEGRVKKVDVGGGMIHGSAEDFAGDESGRILLSHTSAPVASRPAGDDRRPLRGRGRAHRRRRGPPAAALGRADPAEPYAPRIERRFRGDLGANGANPALLRDARAGEGSRAAIEGSPPGPGPRASRGTRPAKAKRPRSV